jgi:hypothetical protein
MCLTNGFLLCLIFTFSFHALSSFLYLLEHSHDIGLFYSIRKLIRIKLISIIEWLRRFRTIINSLFDKPSKSVLRIFSHIPCERIQGFTSPNVFSLNINRFQKSSHSFKHHGFPHFILLGQYIFITHGAHKSLNSLCHALHLVDVLDNTYIAF